MVVIQRQYLEVHKILHHDDTRVGVDAVGFRNCEGKSVVTVTSMMSCHYS